MGTHPKGRGHHRVAARVLNTLGFEPPAAWWSLPALAERERASTRAYYRVQRDTGL